MGIFDSFKLESNGFENNKDNESAIFNATRNYIIKLIPVVGVWINDYLNEYRLSQLETVAKNIDYRLEKLEDKNIGNLPVFMKELDDLSFSQIEDNESLKEYFENLLVNTLDSKKAQVIDPNFSNILKNLNKGGILLLSEIKRAYQNNEKQHMHPLVSLRVWQNGGTSFTPLQNKYLTILYDDKNTKWEEESKVIPILVQFGLVEIDENAWVLDNEGTTSFYDKFYETEEYKRIKKRTEENKAVEVLKQRLVLTNYGIMFLEAIS